MLLRQAQEKKYDPKFDGTPCALDLQPDALEKKGKQPPVFIELLGEERRHSFAAKTSKLSEQGVS